MDFLFQTPYVFDLTLAGVVLLFAALGAYRGLVRSFCSLLGLLLALAGGSMVADLLAPALSAQAAPMVGDFLREHLDALTASGALSLEGAEGFLPQVARAVLEGQEWSLEAINFLPEFTQAVAQWVIHPVLFFLAFLVILVVWHVISNALDLVARLPVLSSINSFGGFLFGSLKGVIALLLVHLLIQAFRPDLLPDDLFAHSYILTFLRDIQIPTFF